VIFVLEKSVAVPFAKARKSVIIRAGPFLPFSSHAKLEQNRIRAIIDPNFSIFVFDYHHVYFKEFITFAIYMMPNIENIENE